MAFNLEQAVENMDSTSYRDPRLARCIGVTGILANIDVDDLARGMQFYCSAFGLRIGRRFGGWVADTMKSRPDTQWASRAAA